MSSLFDSEVYAERQRLPGVSVSLTKLLNSLLWAITDDSNERKVSLSVEYRHDVDTSQWWTIQWGDCRAEAKELELCLFRAAVLARRDDERSRKYAGMPSEETG